MKPTTKSSRKHSVRPVAAAFAGLAVFAGTVAVPAAASASSERGEGYRADRVVVANRGSGDVSVINTRSLAVRTVDLPGTAEPMYVSHNSRKDTVLVGDRASSTIVALDDTSYKVVGTVSVGAGVFHQWLDEPSQRVWVTGTTNKTVSVVDAKSLSLVTTFALPSDVIAAGGVPHDVFVKGSDAFVSVVGLTNGGMVLRYSTKTFKETGRINVGGDPHLFVQGEKLYVASQDADTVSLYNSTTLALRSTINVPNAHGIWVEDGNKVYATDIADAGKSALWQLNGRLSKVTATADTAAATPHNITVADEEDQLWVTHSGPTSNQVTVVALDDRGFGKQTSVKVGLNPFGLAVVDN